jgi:hypothetical protein
MNKLIGIGVVIAVIGLWAFFAYMSYSNAEVRQRNLITAKQKENTTHLDTTLKTISQTAQVSQQQMASIKEIIVGNAEARKVPNSGKLALMIHEAVPNVDAATFNNLQNIIVASRATFQRNQTALLDMSRVHNNMLTEMPSSWFVGGRPAVEIKIVTSTRVENAFETGKDDDDSVFAPKTNKPSMEK